MQAGVVEIVPAGRLPGVLRHRGQQLQEAMWPRWSPTA
jgi:hypothetical protein